MYSLSDSSSKMMGAHNFKAGFYGKGRKIETAGGQLAGLLTTSPQRRNPFFQANTKDGLANASSATQDPIPRAKELLTQDK